MVWLALMMVMMVMMRVRRWLVKLMRKRNDGGSFYNTDLTNCPEPPPFVNQQEDAGQGGERKRVKVRKMENTKGKLSRIKNWDVKFSQKEIRRISETFILLSFSGRKFHCTMIPGRKKGWIWSDLIGWLMYIRPIWKLDSDTLEYDWWYSRPKEICGTENQVFLKAGTASTWWRIWLIWCEYSY